MEPSVADLSGYQENGGKHGGVCVAPPAELAATATVIDQTDASKGAIFEIRGSTFAQEGPQPSTGGPKTFAICKGREFYLHPVDEDNEQEQEASPQKATDKVLQTVQEVRSSVSNSETKFASALGRAKSPNKIRRWEGHQAAPSTDPADPAESDSFHQRAQAQAEQVADRFGYAPRNVRCSCS